ncbi:hypothetical protein LNQ52_32025 [Klebsiella pneumoniae subsp. pneumoniae]|nr:hypothetical protein [Klebsiella pneumoniae subsp. pneumoniae]
MRVAVADNSAVTPVWRTRMRKTCRSDRMQQAEREAGGAVVGAAGGVAGAG